MPRVPRPHCCRAAQSIGVAPAKVARKTAPTCDVRSFPTAIKSLRHRAGYGSLSDTALTV